MSEVNANKRGPYAPCAGTPGLHLLESRSLGREHNYVVNFVNDPENAKLTEGERIHKDESGFSFKISYKDFDDVFIETYCGLEDNGKRFVRRFKVGIKDGKVSSWREIDYAKAKTLKKAYKKLING